MEGPLLVSPALSRIFATEASKRTRSSPCTTSSPISGTTGRGISSTPIRLQAIKAVAANNMVLLNFID